MRTVATHALLLAVAFAAVPAAAVAQHKTTYTILLGGKKAGTETVVRSMPDSGTYQDVVRVEMNTPGGMGLTIDTTLVQRETVETLIPVRYTFDAKAAGRETSVRLTFGDGHARGTITEAGKERKVDLKVAEDFVLLENNVFHPYHAMYRRYNFDKGGVQTVPALVPSAGVQLEVKMERKGTVRVKRAGSAEKLEKIEVKLGNLVFDLYGTRGGRFLFLECEAQALRAARPGYESAELPLK
jgi:hypothetical protein